MTNEFSIITNLLTSNLVLMSAPPTPDYNWFYSTVAQTYSSFSGVLLAFFISNAFVEIKQIDIVIKDIDTAIYELKKIFSNFKGKKNASTETQYISLKAKIDNIIRNYSFPFILSVIDNVIYILMLCLLAFGTFNSINSIPMDKNLKSIVGLPGQKLILLLPIFIGIVFIMIMSLKSYYTLKLKIYINKILIIHYEMNELEKKFHTVQNQIAHFNTKILSTK